MNISFTTLEEAWGEDFCKRKQNKEKKYQKKMIQKYNDEMYDKFHHKSPDSGTKHENVHKKSLSIEITNPSILNYLNRFRDEYQAVFVSNVLYNFINQDNTQQNNTVTYLIIILITILLLDKFI